MYNNPESSYQPVFMAIIKQINETSKDNDSRHNQNSLSAYIVLWIFLKKGLSWTHLIPSLHEVGTINILISQLSLQKNLWATPTPIHNRTWNSWTVIFWNIHVCIT